MSYKKTKIILFVWAVVFLAMTSLLVYEFIKLGETREYTTTLEQEIIQEKASIQSFETLVKNASNIKADSEKANTYFIRRDEVVDFLSVIEALASVTNTQITVQSVTEKKLETQNSLLSVALTAKGSYSNLHYLVKMLEELPYQTEVQSVKLSNEIVSDDTKKVTSSWSADISIVGVMY